MDVGTYRVPRTPLISPFPSFMTQGWDCQWCNQGFMQRSFTLIVLLRCSSLKITNPSCISMDLTSLYVWRIFDCFDIFRWRWTLTFYWQFQIGNGNTFSVFSPNGLNTCTPGYYARTLLPASTFGPLFGHQSYVPGRVENGIFRNSSEQNGWLKTKLGQDPASIIKYIRTRSSIKQPSQN